MRGRPLRFLALTLGGWVAVRVALLWPDLPPVTAIAQAVVPRAAAAAVPMQPMRPPRETTPRPPVTRRAPPPPPRPATLLPQHAPMPSRPAPLPPEYAPKAVPPMIPPPLPPAPTRRHGVIGSAWLLARGGSAGTLAGGRLGGSQAGVRLALPLDWDRRVLLLVRAAMPLRGAGAEAAAGVEFRLPHLPVRLIAEQRFALGRGRGGPTVMAIGGFGPTQIAAGLRAEGYAQLGVIARGDAEAFGDGLIRVTRAVAIAGTTFDLGVGAWGAGQRGVRRVDLGPTVGLRVPVAGHAVRLTLDWRARVAGRAAPRSGPALTLGTDF